MPLLRPGQLGPPARHPVYYLPKADLIIRVSLVCLLIRWTVLTFATSSSLLPPTFFTVFPAPTSAWTLRVSNQCCQFIQRRF